MSTSREMERLKMRAPFRTSATSPAMGEAGARIVRNTPFAMWLLASVTPPLPTRRMATAVPGKRSAPARAAKPLALNVQARFCLALPLVSRFCSWSVLRLNALLGS